MESESVSYFTSRPAFPWSEGTPGLLALAVVALALVGLTLWTYLGDPRASRRRLALLIGLRLLALILAVITLLRPSLAIQEDPKWPSRVAVVADISESMTIQDEFNDQTRWQVVRSVLERCRPVIDELREQRNVQVDLHLFADGLREFDIDAIPDGPSTDFGTMLHDLFERYQNEADPLRGLIVVSDGADNGTARPALSEAARWQSLAPIYPFAVGKPTTASDVRDLSITALTADPSPAPIKGEMTISAVINAPGFERSRPRVRVFFDDVEVKNETVELLRTEGNRFSTTVDAPAEPGEVKLTVKVDPLPGEVTDANNTIETYITVTKEGLSVLAVDRLRLELTFIRDVLARDRRVRYYESIRQTDAPPPGGARDAYGFDRQFYDVIILGDVSARRLAAGSPETLAEIARRVREDGAGLLMTGGFDSFGGTPGQPGSGDWAGTPIADLLPVEIGAGGQLDEPTRMFPTDQGERHYLMRLDPDPGESADLWRRLNDPENRSLMTGRNQLGRVKPGATVLARADDPVNGPPVLVGWDVGKGRVLAFAGDSTWMWRRLGVPVRIGQPVTREGLEVHQRFWKQVALWLARQEEVEGNAYVSPEFRRMPVRGKQELRMGLRGGTGNELEPETIEYQIVLPGREPDPNAWQPPDRDADGRPRVPYEPLLPGEYRALVRGSGTDTDGTPVSGEDEARFIVYPEVSGEMLRKAADHDFLVKLRAAASPGSADPAVMRAEDLPQFLLDLTSQPLETIRPKPRFLPDWRRDAMPAFLPAVLVAFVCVLGFEWGLRRLWGMK